MADSPLRQNQNVGAGGQAIQATRDVLIGFSPEQVTLILNSLANLITTYQAQAKQIVEARLDEFRDEILRKFATHPQPNIYAFSDPDFQEFIHESQKTYARRGDANTLHRLIHIIADRMNRDPFDRISTVQRLSVKSIGELGLNELAELIIIALINADIECASIGDLSAFYKENVVPFVPLLSRSLTSYKLLSIAGCANERGAHIPLLDLLFHKNSHIFSYGFDIDTLIRCTQTDLAKDFVNDQTTTPISEGGSLVRFRTRRAYLDFLAGIRCIDEFDLDNTLDYLRSKNMSRYLIAEIFMPDDRRMRTLSSIWNEFSLGSLSLTPIGLTIAHTNASLTLPRFDIPLTEWVN